jgi:hypothetical protein
LKDGMVALTLVNEEQCTCYTEVGDRAKWFKHECIMVNEEVWVYLSFDI